MSGRNGGASAIAALALAVHRAPARHPELLHGNDPLPPGVGILLRLAGGTPIQELDPALISLASESELRKAALFFIEQVLFRRDADHYRLLGLTRDAATEQIKEHHRLLMRLFHPDRDTQLGETREHYATRANLAYNTLRDAGSRADYDSTLKSVAAAPARGPRRAPMPVRRRMAQPESYWSVRVYPLLMRYLPQWVLAGTALVSVAVVGMVYLFNPPVHLPEPASFPAGVAAVEAPPEPKPAEAVEVAAANITPQDDEVAQLKRSMDVAEAAPAANDSLAADASVDPPAQAGIRETVKPTAAPRARPSSTTPSLSRPAASAVPDRTAGVASAAPAATAAAKPIQKPASVAMAATAVPAVATSAAKPDVIAVPAASPPPVIEPSRPQVAAAEAAPASEPPPPPRPPLPDPNVLLSQFLQAYERGDIQACLSLLDDGVRTEAGGKSEVRREYDTLFRSTDLRHVKILSMNWSRDGEFIRGEGRYRATLMRKGETLLRTQDGKLRVELVRRGNSAVINELYYLAGRS